MQRIIVSDTSCLILLDKIGRIDLLNSIFGKVTVTSAIAREYGKQLPDFIDIKDPINKKYSKLLESSLDSGEASAIALALENENSLLIIDEYKGRREANLLDINYTGTIGILIVAKEKKLIISFSEVVEEIDKTNFRLSKKLVDEAKKKTNE